MQIQSINSVSRFSYVTKNKVNEIVKKEESNFVSLPETFGRDLVVFKSANLNMFDKVMQLPLEEKIAYSF